MAKHTLKALRNTARLLKYVWPFFNIMKERVNPIISNFTCLLQEKTGSNFLLLLCNTSNPANIYLFKVNNGTLEKVEKYVQSLQ